MRNKCPKILNEDKYFVSKLISLELGATKLVACEIREKYANTKVCMCCQCFNNQLSRQIKKWSKKSKK